MLPVVVPKCGMLPAPPLVFDETVCRNDKDCPSVIGMLTLPTPLVGATLHVAVGKGVLCEQVWENEPIWVNQLSVVTIPSPLLFAVSTSTPLRTGPAVLKTSEFIPVADAVPMPILSAAPETETFSVKELVNEFALNV